MQFKHYKKYLKRILDLKSIINPEDEEYLRTVNEIYESLKREAVENNYKAMLFNLLLLEDDRNDNIYMTWGNKFKVSGGSRIVRLYEGILATNLETQLSNIDMNKYPYLRILKEGRFGDISFKFNYHIRIDFSFDLKNVDFNTEEFRLLVREILEYILEAKELVYEDIRRLGSRRYAV